MVSIETTLEDIQKMIDGYEALIDFKIQDLNQINDDLKKLKKMKEDYEPRNNKPT